MSDFEAISFEIYGLFNSFKPHRDVRFHRTLDFPPRTTLLGLCGAALGLSDVEIYEKWDDHKPLHKYLEFAVFVNSIQGRVRDNWTIIKYAGSKEPFRAMQVRELLFRPHYTICVASTEEWIINLLHKSFHDPQYPLCLGRDDEIIRLENMIRLQLSRIREKVTVTGAIIPLGILHKSVEKDRAKLLKSIYIMQAPRYFRLDDGIREPQDRRNYVYIKQETIFEDVEAYSADKQRSIIFI